MSTTEGAIDKKSLIFLIWMDVLPSATENRYANETFDINKICIYHF